MILYFNCRITSHETLHIQKNSTYFYPITYPINFSEASYKDQFQILLETLDSYSKINFTYCFFNIEIDNINSILKEKIATLVSSRFGKSIKSFNFTRPSTKSEWINDILKISKTVDSNEPVLVAHNHDHLFLEKNSLLFESTIKKVFKSPSNFKKVFYYSHSPECISWVINGKNKIKFHDSGDLIFESSKINTWLDGFCVMSLETLLHIFSNAKISNSSDYLPRYDWEGVSYKNLNLTAYIYPREFFKHFDGYGHVTGMRFVTSVYEDVQFIFDKNNLDSLINFYYRKWLHLFVLMIRDKLQNSPRHLQRDMYIELIEFSLIIFSKTYLEQDHNAGELDTTTHKKLDIILKNNIYYNANKIYAEIVLDNKLRKKYKFKNYLINYLKKIARILF